MRKNGEEKITKKYLRKVKSKWVVVSASVIALIGAGGFYTYAESLEGTASETSETVSAEKVQVTVKADNAVRSEWTANTVKEVEQEIDSQKAEDSRAYQIQWGDTLWALSQASGVSVNQLAQWNNIANPDLIFANDFLNGILSKFEAVKQAAQNIEKTVDKEDKPAELKENKEESKAVEKDSVEEKEAEETGEKIVEDDAAEETPEAVEVEPAEDDTEEVNEEANEEKIAAGEQAAEPASEGTDEPAEEDSVEPEVEETEEENTGEEPETDPETAPVEVVEEETPVEDSEKPADEPKQEEPKQEEPKQEEPSDEPVDEEEVIEETPEEEPDEETGEPVEKTPETPVADVLVPEKEGSGEDVIPEKEDDLIIRDIIETDEIVEPQDDNPTDQSTAIETEPESHKEESDQFVMPAQGYVSSEYGYRIHPISKSRKLHAGIDIAGGGPIVAAQSGKVVQARNDRYGWGYYVKIDHGKGVQTLYAHMRAGSLKVKEGDTVTQGQQIGTMGTTGSSTGVHLHFEVYVNGKQVNPRPYLPF